MSYYGTPKFFFCDGGDHEIFVKIYWSIFEKLWDRLRERPPPPQFPPQFRPRKFLPPRADDQLLFLLYHGLKFWERFKPSLCLTGILLKFWNVFFLICMAAWNARLWDVWWLLRRRILSENNPWYWADELRNEVICTLSEKIKKLQIFHISWSQLFVYNIFEQLH